MTASRSIYESARMAAGYAFARPPVHPHILQMVADQLYSSRRPLRGHEPIAARVAAKGFL